MPIFALLEAHEEHDNNWDTIWKSKPSEGGSEDIHSEDIHSEFYTFYTSQFF